MTNRIRYPIMCDCGHTGFIQMNENDQPYTASYEKYLAINLDSDGTVSTEGVVEWSEILKKLNLKCSQCKNLIELKHISNI